MSLSQRLGITEVRSVLQGRSLDDVTRTRLWNVFALTVPAASSHPTWMWELYQHIWADFFKTPVDDIPEQPHIRERLKHVFLQEKWYRVYDLIEFILNSPCLGSPTTFAAGVEKVLNEEFAGFRIMQGLFVQITDETEIAAIQDAFAATAGDAFAPSRAHLATALQMLSDREDPDYRNSIKESISAVESTIQVLTGDDKADLAKGLKLLEKETPLHGALGSALGSLYGYTSDADGIRHALSAESNADAATAKFMLVICSAFVVYLVQAGAAE